MFVYLLGYLVFLRWLRCFVSMCDLVISCCLFLLWFGLLLDCWLDAMFGVFVCFVWLSLFDLFIVSLWCGLGCVLFV